MYSCRAQKVREKRLTPPAYVPEVRSGIRGDTVTDDGTLFLAGLLRQSEASWHGRNKKHRRAS